MAEKNSLIEGDKISYKGIFELRELMHLINNYLAQLGYDKRVTKNEHQILEKRKIIDVELKPWKKISDYIKYEMKILVSSDFEDVQIEIEGKEKIVQKGKISIKFDAVMMTDYEHNWETKPEYFFLRTIFNKWIYKSKLTQWDNLLKEHVHHLKTEISSFLNLGRYTTEEFHKQMNVIR